MKLSGVGLRRRPTKLIYPDHRPSPWPNGVIAPLLALASTHRLVADTSIDPATTAGLRCASGVDPKRPDATGRYRGAQQQVTDGKADGMPKGRRDTAWGLLLWCAHCEFRTVPPFCARHRLHVARVSAPAGASSL
jgi:hypothetical protein